MSNNKPSAYFSVPDVDFKQNIRHPLSKRLRKKDNSFFAYFYNIRMPLMLPVILFPFILHTKIRYSFLKLNLKDAAIRDYLFRAFLGYFLEICKVIHDDFFVPIIG